MKLTKTKLKQIIKETMVEEELDDFSVRYADSRRLRDAIVGYLEVNRFFEKGAIPQSVISVIENSSLRITDAVKRVLRVNDEQR